MSPGGVKGGVNSHCSTGKKWASLKDLVMDLKGRRGQSRETLAVFLWSVPSCWKVTPHSPWETEIPPKQKHQ